VDNNGSARFVGRSIAVEAYSDAIQLLNIHTWAKRALGTRRYSYPFGDGTRTWFFVSSTKESEDLA